MIETLLINRARRATFAGMRRKAIFVALVAGSLPLGGCVTVNAPKKPIEINLNINITQEVVYRLNDDAKNLIQDNPGIF